MNYREELTEFITKVFNYYNGKINIVNYNVNLNIVWLYDPNERRAAFTVPATTITIYPINQMKMYDHEWAKCFIIECIIHELFHADQFIIYSMLNNPDYVNYIEGAVEYMTSWYLANYSIEISKLFGVDFNRIYRDEINKMMHDNMQYAGTYNRIDFIKYICLIIDSLCMNTNTSEGIIDSILPYLDINKNKKFSIKIGDTVINVRDGNNIINIVDFNNKLQNLFFKYKIRSINISKIYNDNDFILVVKFIANGGVNSMIRII